MDRRVYRRMDGIVGMNFWLSSRIDCWLVGMMDSRQSDAWYVSNRTWANAIKTIHTNTYL